ASSQVLASPTTSRSVSALSRSASPRRTISWSSRRNNRIWPEGATALVTCRFSPLAVRPYLSALTLGPRPGSRGAARLAIRRLNAERATDPQPPRPWLSSPVPTLRPARPPTSPTRWQRRLFPRDSDTPADVECDRPRRYE